MTLTQVHVDLRHPDGLAEVAAAGDVEFALASRVHDGTGDFIITTESFTADLIAGQVTVSLRPTGIGQAWTSRENVPGGVRRWFTVPTSATVVQYADLVDVDPNTLTPVPADAQWVVDLNAVDVRLTAQEARIELYDSPTPPVAPVFPYIRVERDLDGDVQNIYLGTAT